MLQNVLLVLNSADNKSMTVEVGDKMGKAAIYFGKLQFFTTDNDSRRAAEEFRRSNPLANGYHIRSLCGKQEFCSWLQELLREEVQYVVGNPQGDIEVAELSHVEAVAELLANNDC